MITRRRSLQLAGGVLAARAMPSLAEELPRLKDAAARAGLRFGSNSDIEFSLAPPEYGALFADQCGLYAAGLSWGYVCSANRACDPLRVDPNIAFADAHQLKLTGGHLLWHENMPSWFTAMTPAEAKQAATQHITTIAKQYAGRIYAWNVVNEAIEPNDGRADGLRRSVLIDQLGDDFFDQAFRTARAADPHCLLAYNDYGMEMATRDGAARRAALLGLLDRLSAKGTPIDAVGLQSHLWLGNGNFDEAEYRRFLKAIAGHGVKIIISELDVFDAAAPADIAPRDQAVADLYGKFLGVALDEPAVCAVVSWGLCDRYTWLTPIYNRRFGRPDGLPTRPLAFDDDLKPKPAFQKILAAFNAAPHR